MEESHNEGSQSWQRYHEEMASNMLLDKLKKAKRLKDPELLQMVISDCKEAGMGNEDSVTKAETQLQVIRLKLKLQKAMLARDTDAISGIITEVDGLSFDKPPMYHEMLAARNVVERTKRLAELKHDVLALDRRTMAEMRSYDRPPRVLHEVLQAALLLLGEDDETTAVWKTCRALCAPNGRNGLQRKMMKFDSSSVEPELAARCREILDNYTVFQAQAVSAGAATFYVWARGVIDEVEKKNPGRGQPEKSVTIQRQKELLQAKLDSPT